MTASYAIRPGRTRGRRHPESPAPTRTEFQRDRDRIVHSTAFRRLVYKTQVFLNHEGDLFRTRLTHSLEVAQLGRSIARSLGLNEDLVEAIALAHDLGHTPFGHAGQDALNECMQAHGGFEHNLQSLRVVDQLEERYPDFDGLNLSFETREGILKHCSRANAQKLEARRARRRRPALPGPHPAQPGSAAVQPGRRDRLQRARHRRRRALGPDHPRAARRGAAVCAVSPRQTLAEHPQLQGRRLLYESIRRMLSAQVYDVIDATAQALAASGVDSAEAARSAAPMVRFSPGMQARIGRAQAIPAAQPVPPPAGDGNHERRARDRS